MNEANPAVETDVEVNVEPATEQPDTESKQEDANDAPSNKEESSGESKAQDGASKAIKRLKRQKQQAMEENKALKAELEEARKAREARPQEATETPKRPKISEFESYDDGLEAQIDWLEGRINEQIKAVESKFTEREKKSKPDEYRVQRLELMDENHFEARDKFSDYDKVLEDVTTYNGQLPLTNRVLDELIELENPAYALYAAAKDGDLEGLNRLGKRRLQQTLDELEARGLELSKPKSVSKAPMPISKAKGTGSTRKSLESMTPDELMKWVHS